MKSIALVIFILLFFDTYLYAIENVTKETEEQAVINSNYAYLKTSDGIRLRSLLISYRNHRRDVTWPYENEMESALDFGTSVLFTQGYSAQDDYAGRRVLALVGYKFSSEFQIDLTAGGHILENQNTGSNNTIFSGEIKANYFLWNLFSGYVSLNNDYAYVSLIQPGGVRDQLISTDLNSMTNVHFSDDWQSRIRENYLFISDGNKKLNLDFSLLYGISIENPWFWVGVGAERTAFENYSPSYWSPSEFIAVGPRGEIDFPLLENQLFMNISAGYTYSRDKDSGTTGNGYSISSRLTCGTRNENNFSIFYNKIESIQNGAKWDSTELGLSAYLMF